VRVVGRDHRGQEGDRAVREDDAEACGKDDLLPSAPFQLFFLMHPIPFLFTKIL